MQANTSLHLASNNLFSTNFALLFVLDGIKIKLSFFFKRIFGGVNESVQLYKTESIKFCFYYRYPAFGRVR